LRLGSRRLDVLIWTLIYGGLIGAGLGVALERTGEGYGSGVVGAGALAVVIGMVLVWVRSRRSGP